MCVHVRAMLIDDCDSVLSLWRRCDGVRLCEDDSPQRLARQLAMNPKLSQVGVVGDRLVGSILCLQDGRRGVIRHLAIDPSHRQRGFGCRLVQCCLDELRRQGQLHPHGWRWFGGNPARRGSPDDVSLKAKAYG